MSGRTGWGRSRPNLNAAAVPILTSSFELAFDASRLVARLRDDEPHLALFAQKALTSVFCSQVVLRCYVEIKVQVLRQHALLGRDIGGTGPAAVLA